MRNKEGITLIALIITIIVMLILVAVTISVALNGGLFNNAQDAKIKTQKAVSKEELIATMVGAYDNTGSFDKDLVGTLPSGAKWCGESETDYSSASGEGDWIITENGNKFYIDESGSVLDEKPGYNISLDKYYNIKLKKISEFNWAGILQPLTSYLIVFQNVDNSYSVLLLPTGAESGDLNTPMFMPTYGNFSNLYTYQKIENEYVWDNYNGEDPTKLEIENVKIVSEEEVLSSFADVNDGDAAFPLDYLNLIMEKPIEIQT